jgi:outer membrane protein W
MGTSFQRTAIKGVLDAGLTYQSKNGYFYLGYNRLLNDQVNVAIGRDQFTDTSLPAGFVTLGANWAIETTYNGDRKAVAHFNETFSKKRRFGWFLAAGPSSVFPLQKSDYFTGDRAFLDDLVMSNILPDIAVGFHFQPLDANVALSYRPIVQERSGGNFRQKLRRTSLALETYKYLGDYHGFAPFVGLGVGYDRLKLTETDGENELLSVKREILSPLIVFGWDIRPAHKGDAWLLRTNVRYTPFSELNHRGRTISLRQLEFNFIQLVVFPGRMRAYKSYYGG